jgi:hypothetical protein
VGIAIQDAFYSGVNKQALLEILTGTPAASPADPATPANWMSLARVRVNAGASSLGTITDLRQWMWAALSPGGGGMSFKDSTGSNQNMGWNDAGLVTVRNAIVVPPSAAGTPAATSFGTLPVKLAEVTGSGASGTLSFSSIPSGYRNLFVRYFGQSSSAGAVNVGLQFNGDTGAHYYSNATDLSNASVLGEALAVTTGDAGSITGTSSGNSGCGSIIIHSYAQTTLKIAWTYHSFRLDGGAAGNSHTQIGGGNWVPTTPAAITSIALVLSGGNWQTGSVAELWGEP